MKYIIILPFFLLSFILSSCSEQELAEIEYKSQKSAFTNERVMQKSSAHDAVVSKKLDRSSVVKNSSSSNLIKKKEIKEFESEGSMKNYNEVHVFEKKKINHDDYPEGDVLVGKNLDNQDKTLEKKRVEDEKPLPQEKDRFIIIRSGDDIKSIADEYNISVNVIARENGLKPPYNLEVGQILKLPESKSVSEVTEITEVAKVSKKASAVQLHSQTVDFINPVEGDIICSFGEETEAGRKNEGVNFVANAGSNVHSVASGTVIYASNQLEDYGNLVIVKHDNSLVTTYAHLQQISVQKGQKVTVGDIVGKVGATGNVSSPQLHFAVRKGKDVVDPALYLPK
jgi:murein DD-endopeptidase MepM/ murein hydrolase activator NlpD